jgi:hypothetical protein
MFESFCAAPGFIFYTITVDTQGSANFSNMIKYVCRNNGNTCIEEETIDDSQVHAFVRGEASEHIITALANIGVAQVPIEMDGIGEVVIIS